jgi:hypothetical protein
MWIQKQYLKELIMNQFLNQCLKPILLLGLLLAVLAGCSIDGAPLPGTTVLRVDGQAAGPADGLTWATAFHTVQAAIVAAPAGGGDEIWIAAGTYVNGGGTGPVAAMKAGVSLFGGFAGTEMLRSQRDATAHETILDGAGTANHVVLGAAGAAIDGFTVRNGNAITVGVASNSCGGGIYNVNSAMSISHCLFAGNNAHEGGAIYNENSTSLIEYCVFQNNNAADGGGGILNTANSSAMVAFCTFTGNYAGFGGGLANFGSAALVTDCDFSAN